MLGRAAWTFSANFHLTERTPMSLLVAVQMDPIERINIRGDSTFALMLEAQARGHQLAYYTPDRMALVDGTLFATVHAVAVRDEVGNHFTLGEASLAGWLMFQTST